MDRAEELRRMFADTGADVDIRMREPMAGHTSLGIGGPVDVLLAPRGREALGRVLRAARSGGVPVFALGGGTNLLVRDEGLEGAAVTVGYECALEALSEGAESVTLRVGAGLGLGRLVGHARGLGLSGIEGLAGIPGRVGGAVAGNAGAFGCEMKDVVLGVEVMDREGEVRTIPGSAMGFGYRLAAVPDGAVILSAEVALRRADRGDVLARTAECLKKKKATQPLGARSAGCAFKNPEGRAAGELIDKAGCKGMRVGGVEVSRAHANFFVNAGGGTASDYLALMECVADRVLAAFGVRLEPEVRVVGRC